MCRFLLLALIFILIGYNFVFAQVELKAEVDKKSINITETLTYKITLETDQRSIPPLDLPKFKDFKIIYQQQSSNFSFVQNKPKIKLNYTFVLKPIKAGKLKIEPATLKIKKEIYSTEGFEIEVKENETPPEVSPEKPTPSIPFDTEKITL